MANEMLTKHSLLLTNKRDVDIIAKKLWEKIYLRE